jgi:hypothetical protein
MNAGRSGLPIRPHRRRADHEQALRVRRERLAPLLITAFLVLIGAAWIVTNPPGLVPDEGAHYVKAVGVGGGDL